MFKKVDHVASAVVPSFPSVSPSLIAVTGLLTVPMTMIAGRTVGRRWLTAASGLVSLAFGMLMVRALGGPLALFAAGPPF